MPVCISVKVARSLARLPAPPWEKVEQQVWRDCPQPASDSLVLSSRSQTFLPLPLLAPQQTLSRLHYGPSLPKGMM